MTNRLEQALHKVFALVDIMGRGFPSIRNFNKFDGRQIPRSKHFLKCSA
jgi:hypothetical protein